MIVVCGIHGDYSTTICWSPDAIPLSCFAKCGWDGAMDRRKGTGVHRDNLNFPIWSFAPVEYALFQFRHAVWGGVFETQCGAVVSLLYRPVAYAGFVKGGGFNHAGPERAGKKKKKKKKEKRKRKNKKQNNNPISKGEGGGGGFEPPEPPCVRAWYRLTHDKSLV